MHGGAGGASRLTVAEHDVSFPAGGDASHEYLHDASRAAGDDGSRPGGKVNCPASEAHSPSGN